MIEVKIRTDNKKIESSYDINGKVVLADIGLAVAEIERIKLLLLDEIDNCPPDIEISK